MLFKLSQRAVYLHLGLFWGLLGVPPAGSGCRASSSAATAHCVAVSGVRPSAGGWRPASTASPPPPVLRVLNIPKVVELRLKTSVKTIDKRLQFSHLSQRTCRNTDIELSYSVCWLPFLKPHHPLQFSTETPLVC
ncbi:hypothetical protein PFLUV_G00036510 [Perca fluviatilis]|uniref:Uncharacterized protein n=1 Tax=Perca fluviatilis TaxID=8168 RepID=A0A6A5FPA6_PERFL|nr:hypothetical protein PFLUV_G00036510 [Perca fluviatilis]